VTNLGAFWWRRSSSHGRVPAGAPSGRLRLSSVSPGWAGRGLDAWIFGASCLRRIFPPAVLPFLPFSLLFMRRRAAVRPPGASLLTVTVATLAVGYTVPGRRSLRHADRAEHRYRMLLYIVHPRHHRIVPWALPRPFTSGLKACTLRESNEHLAA